MIKLGWSCPSNNFSNRYGWYKQDCYTVCMYAYVSYSNGAVTNSEVTLIRYCQSSQFFKVIFFCL